MESITDFWKNARERYTNPFAFSFVVSWFCINWKITLAVLFNEEVPIQYQNIYDFVSDELYFLNGLVWPIVSAITYCLVIPSARQVFSLVNTYLDKVGTSWNLEASKGGKVSVEKYLTIRKDLLEKRKLLEEIIGQDSVKDSNYNTLLTAHQQIQKHLADSQKNVSILQTTVNDLQGIVDQLRDVSLIAGEWDVNLDTSAGSVGFVVDITSGHYASSLEQMEATPVKGFFYDGRNKLVVFSRTRYLIDAPTKAYTYILTIGTDHMEGTENGNPISFNRRVSPIPDALRPRRN